jgi:hypothetical protein
MIILMFIVFSGLVAAAKLTTKENFFTLQTHHLGMLSELAYGANRSY